MSLNPWQVLIQVFLLNKIKFNSYRSNISKCFDYKIINNFELEHIKFGENVLFLTFMALHKYAPNSQIVMYAKAVE